MVTNLVSLLELPGSIVDVPILGPYSPEFLF